MTMLSIGDMAQTQFLNRRNVELKQNLTQLSKELSTGRVADIPRALEGDYSQFAEIERSLRLLESFETSNQEAAAFSDAMQITLENIQEMSETFGASLLLSDSTRLNVVSETNVMQAKEHLSALISSLNTRVAGRSMFAGAATDQVPLIDSDSLLSAVRTAAINAGPSTPQDLHDAVSDWFDDPAGFSQTAYRGSSEPLSPFQIAEGETSQITLTADDLVFRETMKGLTLTALAADFGFTLSQQADAMRIAGEGMLANNGRLTAARVEVGTTQARIDSSATRMAAERTGQEMAKGALVGVDSFEAFTRLEETQIQLETLYTVTSRLSRLSLLNFIQ